MTRPIEDAIADTLRELGVLNQATEARKRADANALAAIVGRLDDSWGAEDEAPIVDSRLAGLPARRPEAPRGPDGEPGDVPPTRPGHEWGASMRQKFIREARDSGAW